MTIGELENCIEEYGKDIYSFCRYLTCSTQEADDLYQDTFLKALELQEKIAGEYNPKSYLLSVTIRIWKNRRRKFARRKRIAAQQSYVDAREYQNGRNYRQEAEGEKGAENGLGHSPEEVILNIERQTQVRRAVERLPEKYRLAVLLFYMEELSVEHIAEVQDIPSGTVKSRLYHARKILEKELEAVFYEK